jgi:hypothetical protein
MLPFLPLLVRTNVSLGLTIPMGSEARNLGSAVHQVWEERWRGARRGRATCFEPADPADRPTHLMK